MSPVFKVEAQVSAPAKPTHGHGGHRVGHLVMDRPRRQHHTFMTGNGSTAQPLTVTSVDDNVEQSISQSVSDQPPQRHPQPYCHRSR